MSESKIICNVYGIAEEREEECKRQTSREEKEKGKGKGKLIHSFILLPTNKHTHTQRERLVSHLPVVSLAMEAAGPAASNSLGGSHVSLGWRNSFFYNNTRLI